MKNLVLYFNFWRCIIPALICVLDRSITSVDENTANYSDHQDVSLHFPKYLKETVNMLIKR